MGSWGTSVFDNDNACDWVRCLEIVGLQYVIDALEKVHFIGPKYLPQRVTDEALAACEVVARLQGSFVERDAFTERVDTWVENNNFIVMPEIADLAIAVIDRILFGPSEALETWISDDHLNSWKANVVDLKKRIQQSRAFYLSSD